MARAGCRTNGLQKLEGDDVEKSIEVLDKVLLEFEDPDSLPHIPIHLEPESPSQGNQSEDDGYMSMNGRRAKIHPEFHQPLSNESLSSPPSSSSVQIMVEEKPHPVHNDDERVITENIPSPSSSSSPVTSDESVGVVEIEDDRGAKCIAATATPPPSPERAEEIISNFLPKISPSTTPTDLIVSSNIENNDRLNNVKNLQNQLDNTQIINTTNANKNMIIQCSNYDVIVHNKSQLNDNGAIKGVMTPGIINLDGKIIKDSRENDGSTVVQTTLPKIRPSNVIPSRYSSLPCSGPARSAFGTHLDRFGRGMGGGSFDGGVSNLNDRNILGIGISAVHDAVLRGGVAKLPEPIVNEHPVTIYPGRQSPPGRRVPPRTLPGSIERHREVCRNPDPNCIIGSPTTNINLDFTDNINNCTNLIGSTTKIMSPLQRIAITKSPSSPLVAVQQHIILQNSVSSNQLIDNKNLLNSLQIPPRKPQRNYVDGVGGNGIGNGINIDKINYNNKNNNINNKNHNNKHNKSDSCSSSEEFSDDSLEGQSLPPPPAPPTVPPPPSLSAPVTPSKRGSIAWEINLDDDLPPPPSIAQQNDNLSYRNGNKNKNSKNCSTNGKDKPNKLETSASAKIIARHRGRTQSGGSQSSVASTPGNSGGSISNQNSPQHHHNQLIKNRSSSMEWPEPPTISNGGDSAPICSTEDEAASIYSDSDDVIPSYPINMTGKGTYVIRKGRKERQRLSEIHTSMSSSINSRLSNEGSLLSGMTASQSLLIPNSRHSIDLGSSGTTIHSPISGTGNCLPTMLSPRSRLSLDLSSPNNATSDHPPVSLHTILSGDNNVGSNNTSPSNATQLHQTHQQQYITTNNSSSLYTGEFNKYTNYETTTGSHHNHHHETNGNGGSCGNLGGIGGNNTSNVSNGNLNNNNNLSNSTGNMNGSLTRATPSNDVISTPRRELAPPIEEDEEQDSESQSRGAPLRQIENNISALLRGDIAVARVGDISHARRPLGFRPGVHKSESAKEMLLSQTAFGPLPPSPPNSSPEPEIEIDAFPPLPPSPQENVADDEEEIDESDIVRGLQHGIRLSSRTRLKSASSTDPHIPPTVPPHRSSLGGGICGVNVIVGGHQQLQPSINTLKTRSMDAGYTKKYSTNSPHGSIPGTLPCEMPTSNSSRRRLQSGAFPKRAAQSPREERRLQTSCSLPETPIFARGCDIARTPHRRAPEVPGPVCSGGSRTAPRTNPNTTTSLGSSIVGIGNTTMGGGRRPLAGAEMLRLAGGPARGWYPKQRAMRPASTEHLDRLHRTQGSMRAWDTAIGVGGVGMSTSGMGASGGGCVGRKPLTLPPNLTPKFFNKSPREALRRVTSLLIKKGNGKDKESKHRDKEVFTTSSVVHRSPGSAGDIPINQVYINNGTATSSSTASSTNHPNQIQHKKKGFFKNFWKKSKHYSLDQQ